MKLDSTNMKVDDNNSYEHRSEQNSGEIKWCKDFNAGKCAFPTCHNGKFAGQVVKLYHICRVCWSKCKDKKFHKAGSEDCQYTMKE